MQPPTGVPGNGPLSMTAAETLPFGAKVTFTWPEPVGPSGFLHDWTLIDPSAAAAAPRSNGAVEPPPLFSGGFAVGCPAAAASAPARSFGWSGCFGGSGTFGAVSVCCGGGGVLPATFTGGVAPVVCPV